MRKLLQNKIVVGGMVVCAIVLVSWRVHTLRQQGFLVGTARETLVSEPGTIPLAEGHAASADKPPQTDLGDGEAVHAVSVWSTFRTNRAAWDELFPVTERSRDPFTPGNPYDDALPEVDLAGALPGSEDLSLQAISIQPAGALVVINQKTLGLGEAVGSFVVERIGFREVLLKHPQGHFVLRFSREPLSNRHGSADSATGTLPSLAERQ